MNKFAQRLENVEDIAVATEKDKKENIEPVIEETTIEVVEKDKKPKQKNIRKKKTGKITAFEKDLKTPKCYSLKPTTIKKVADEANRLHLSESNMIEAILQNYFEEDEA